MQNKSIELRKYRIAALLAEYSHSSQSIIVEELSSLLNISKGMFFLYVNAKHSDKRALSETKLTIIANYFGVQLEDVKNIKRTALKVVL